MFPITSVGSFIRTYGNHCFLANCMTPLDVKEHYLCLSHGPCQSFIQHVCMCWGPPCAGPAQGASWTPVRKFSVLRKMTGAFSGSESLHSPFCKARHKDERSLCTGGLTFMLFKSLKTGLIILYFRKKFLCCKGHENKMHWWSLNDPETKIIIVVINYITLCPMVVS